MDEAERLAQRVSIIDQGKILYTDSPANLKQSFGCDNLEDVFIRLTSKNLRS
jgi:ABC-type multidrug transport system ATPase subunit